MDPKKIRRAWHCFEAFANAKHEVRRLDDAMHTMQRGADEGLETAELVEHAIEGTFDRGDAVSLGFKALNWSPRIDASLRTKYPWKLWHY